MPEQFNLLSYPAVPGVKSQDDTSGAAADAVRERAPFLRDAVMKCLHERGPASADQVAARLREDMLSIRPRFSELRALGLIEPTEFRAKNKSGRAAIVWRIVRKKQDIDA